MNEPKDTAPTPLVGVHSGKCSTNGDVIQFVLEGYDGKLYPFAVPQETIGDIIEALQSLEAMASERRSNRIPEPGGPSQLHKIEVSYEPHRGVVLLKVISRRAPTETLIVGREEAMLLGAALQNVVKLTSN